MKFLQSLSIAVKILIPPAVLVLALVAVSFSALYGLNFQREALSEINDVALDKITLVDEFITLSERVQSDVFRISVLRFMDLPEEDIQPVQERMERGLNDLNVIYGQILREWSLDEEEQAIVGRMKEPLDAFRGQARQAVAVASDNPSFGVILVRAASVPFDEFRGVLAEFLDYQQAKIVRAEAEAAGRATTVSTVILALALGITLVAMVATALVSNRLIARPIRAMTHLMGRLADGDLSIQVGGLKRRDEIGGMAQAVEVFRQNALEKADAQSQREAALEALRENEEKLRHIVEHSTNLFYTHTAGHVLTYLSPQVKDLLGYEPVEAMVRWTELATDHPVNLRGLEITQKAIDTGERQPAYELELRHKQGHAVWVEVREAPVVVDGKAVDIVGALTDITERRRAEKALRESERILNSTGKIGRIGGWEHDLATGKAVWTQALYDIIEIPYDHEPPGVDEHLSYYPPRDRRILEQAYDRAVKNGTPFDLELQVYTSKKKLIWCRAQGEPVYENGECVAMRGTFQDITERKRTEEALRRENEFTDTALDSQMDTFFLFDPVSGKALRWNKTFRDISGYTDEEIARMPAPASYYGPEDLERAVPFVERVIKEGSGTIELELICKDGRKVPTEYRVSAIYDEEGKPKHLISIGRDITERVRAEEALQAYAERLEDMVEERTQALRQAQDQLVRQEKLAALGQLAGGVAHELRNPMAVIKNAAYFLDMTVSEGSLTEALGPEVKESLGILAKEVGVAEDIIGSLLDYARAKPPSRRKVNVNHLLRDVLSGTEVPEGVEVGYELGERLPPIQADPAQLGQVFGNLIRNAIQAMPEGGRLSVGSDQSSVDSDQSSVDGDRLSVDSGQLSVASGQSSVDGGQGVVDGDRLLVDRRQKTGGRGQGSAESLIADNRSLITDNWILITVRDTGVGIPPEDLDKLFEPLFTTKATGIGLGLALVKTLVEGHGGNIGVESEMGKGSTFTVRLPMA